MSKIFKLSLFSALVAVCLVSISVLAQTVETSYKSLTLTSASNTSLSVKVTPVSFSDGKWTYKVEWERKKQAEGSLYISLKSNRTVKQLEISPAEAKGSKNVELSPATNYRLEFYPFPDAKGYDEESPLLLRKFFVTLDVPGANGDSEYETGGDSQTSTDQNDTGSQSSPFTDPNYQSGTSQDQSGLGALFALFKAFFSFLGGGQTNVVVNNTNSDTTSSNNTSENPGFLSSITSTISNLFTGSSGSQDYNLIGSDVPLTGDSSIYIAQGGLKSDCDKGKMLNSANRRGVLIKCLNAKSDATNVGLFEKTVQVAVEQNGDSYFTNFDNGARFRTDDLINVYLFNSKEKADRIVTKLARTKSFGGNTPVTDPNDPEIALSILPSHDSYNRVNPDNIVAHGFYSSYSKLFAKGSISSDMSAIRQEFNNGHFSPLQAGLTYNVPAPSVSENYDVYLEQAECPPVDNVIPEGKSWSFSNGVGSNLIGGHDTDAVVFPTYAWGRSPMHSFIVPAQQNCRVKIASNVSPSQKSVIFRAGEPDSVTYSGKLAGAFPGFGPLYVKFIGQSSKKELGQSIFIPEGIYVPEKVAARWVDFFEDTMGNERTYQNYPYAGIVLDYSTWRFAMGVEDEALLNTVYDTEYEQHFAERMTWDSKETLIQTNTNRPFFLPLVLVRNYITLRDGVQTSVTLEGALPGGLKLTKDAKYWNYIVGKYGPQDYRVKTSEYQGAIIGTIQQPGMYLVTLKTVTNYKGKQITNRTILRFAVSGEDKGEVVVSKQPYDPNTWNVGSSLSQIKMGEQAYINFYGNFHLAGGFKTNGYTRPALYIAPVTGGGCDMREPLNAQTCSGGTQIDFAKKRLLYNYSNVGGNLVGNEYMPDLTQFTDAYDDVNSVHKKPGGYYNWIVGHSIEGDIQPGKYVVYAGPAVDVAYTPKEYFNGFCYQALGIPNLFKASITGGPVLYGNGVSVDAWKQISNGLNKCNLGWLNDYFRDPSDQRAKDWNPVFSLFAWAVSPVFEILPGESQSITPLDVGGFTDASPLIYFKTQNNRVSGVVRSSEQGRVPGSSIIDVKSTDGSIILDWSAKENAVSNYPAGSGYRSYIYVSPGPDTCSTGPTVGLRTGERRLFSMNSPSGSVEIPLQSCMSGQSYYITYYVDTPIACSDPNVSIVNCEATGNTLIKYSFSVIATIRVDDPSASTINQCVPAPWKGGTLTLGYTPQNNAIYTPTDIGTQVTIPIGMNLPLKDQNIPKFTLTCDYGVQSKGISIYQQPGANNCQFKWFDGTKAVFHCYDNFTNSPKCQLQNLSLPNENYCYSSNYIAPVIWNATYGDLPVGTFDYKGGN